MIRKFILLLFLFSVSEVAMAQLRYGIKAGVNLNTIRTTLHDKPNWINFEDSPEPIVGFHVGLFLAMDLSNNFSFRPELEYILKGKHETYGNGQSQRINVSYINIPVIFSYKLAAKCFVEAGPGLGYLISSETDNEKLAFFPSETYTRKLEVAALVGFRYSLIKKCDLIARYSHGLTNIQDLTASDPSTNTSFEYVAKNRVISLSVAYYLK